MPTPVSRRDLLKLLSLSAAGWNPAVRAVAQDAAPPAAQPLNRFPRMVQEYYVRRVREAEQVGLKRQAELKTKADAEGYVRLVREQIRACFGPFPEKTPLNPRVLGVVERDGYRIEKVLFESRPGFYVTSNLYVPTGRALPLPGVVGTCGHSINGKAAEAYQSFAQGLARLGYVTLIFDPIGQGERFQYLDETRTRSLRGAGVGEHILSGNQQLLVGEFFGTWRAWDGIRALDYLLTRDEVDPRHVGVTGNSGGGTMTTWLCGLDDRWTMAAPSCFVTTFRRDMENELPQDSEQCPPGVLAAGLDHADFLAAMAPRPVIILAKERDYFDVRGAEEAYGRLRKLYALLGAEDNIGLFVGPTEHGYSQENREAMYRWFNRVTHVSEAQSEPALTIEKDETLWCAPAGQVAQLNSRAIYEFTRAKSVELGSSRPKLSGPELAAAVRSVLKIESADGVPDYRILRPLKARGYPRPHATTYAIETEPGVHAIVTRLADQGHLSRPPKEKSRAVLFVSHHSADAELRSDETVRGLVTSEKTADFFACDVRGIGESRPDTCGENTFLSGYGSDFFYASYALMLAEPYVGRKTHDVLQVLEWLKSVGYSEVHLAALGWGTLPAMFAAVLSPVVTQVTLVRGLTSYSSVAEMPVYKWPVSCFPHGVLEKFDLPDCCRVLETKKLRLIDMDAGARGA